MASWFPSEGGFNLKLASLPALLLRHSADVTVYTARLVTPADAQAIVTAVLELLDDPKRRLQLARAGQQKAQEFDWGKATDRLERLIYRMVGGRKPDEQGSR